MNSPNGLESMLAKVLAAVQASCKEIEDKILLSTKELEASYKEVKNKIEVSYKEVQVQIELSYTWSSTYDRPPF
jgi:hypothetical protein